MNTHQTCTIRGVTPLYVPLGFRSSTRLIACESRTEKRLRSGVLGGSPLTEPDPYEGGAVMDATQGPSARPVDWDARHHLALSILNWRPPNALTCILAMRALQGWDVQQLMQYERGVKTDLEGDAA